MKGYAGALVLLGLSAIGLTLFIDATNRVNIIQLIIDGTHNMVSSTRTLG